MGKTNPKPNYDKENSGDKVLIKCAFLLIPFVFSIEKIRICYKYKGNIVQEVLDKIFISHRME